MASYTEPALPLEFIQDYEPQYSVEQVTIVSGTAAMLPGRTLGKITASGKYKNYDNAASDGSQAVAGVLMYPVDASAADVVTTMLARKAIVQASALGWGANDSTGITAGIADMALLNPPILAR